LYRRRSLVHATATRGAVQSYATKHLLEGKAHTEALEGAMAAGLVDQGADAMITIRNAGRNCCHADWDGRVNHESSATRCDCRT
jgi:hypothetical protein